MIRSIDRYTVRAGKVMLLLAWVSNAFFRSTLFINIFEISTKDAKHLGAELFFLLLAIGIFFISIRDRFSFFDFAFMELALYNVVDEVMGLGSTYQWYEVPITTVALIIAYFFKSKNG